MPLVVVVSVWFVEVDELLDSVVAFEVSSYCPETEFPDFENAVNELAISELSSMCSVWLSVTLPVVDSSTLDVPITTNSPEIVLPLREAVVVERFVLLVVVVCVWFVVVCVASLVESVMSEVTLITPVI